MAKPKFDPNQPYQEAPENKPKFDPSKPFDSVEENYLSLDQPNMLQSAGSAILSGLSKAGQFVDSYTGSPMRAAIGSYQDGGGTLGALSAYGRQFGEDPANAPSGKEIATKAGLSTENPVLSAQAQMEHDKLYAPNQYQMRMASGGYKDQSFPSKAGIAGFGIDVGADPTNLFAGAGLIKGAGRGILKGASLAGEGIKAADEAVGLTRGLGNAVKSTTIGTVATDTARTIKTAIDGMFHPKVAEDFGHWADVAARNGIDPTLLPESVEFGPGSSISRVARHVRENPMVGEPDMERFRNGLMQVDQAVDNKVHQLAGGPPLNNVEAGNLLREGHDRAVDDLFKRTDFTYKNVVQQAPEMNVAPKSIQSINQKFKEIGDYALKESMHGPTKEGRTQAKNLLEDLQAIRGRMSAVDPKTGTFGSMAQLQETMSSVGKYAFQKGKIGEIAADREKLKDLYFTLRDAFINSTAEQLGPEVAQSLIDTNQQITMFNKNIEPIAKILADKEAAPEKVFRTLLSRGDTKQISALKEMLTPEEFNQLRGSYLQGLITRNSDDTINFGALRSKLQKNTTTISALFEPQEIQDVIELSKLGEKWGPAVLSTSGTAPSNLLSNGIEAVKSGATGKATLELMKEKARAQALEAAASVKEAQTAPLALQGNPIERFIEARQRGPLEESLKGMQILGAGAAGKKREDKSALQRKIQQLQGR